jgi:signal transduction histidine kinase
VRRLADRPPAPPAAPPTRRRGPGLRVRLTFLATALAAGVSGLLLWLGWLLAGYVVSAVPQLPADSTVQVDGIDVPAPELAAVLAGHARDQVLRAGSVAFLCVVAATGILAWSLTGRLLRPLSQVTATARRLSAESLGERIALRGPRDEVAELADTFDAMLDRLQATFSAQQRFVANASHELRTPLAVIRTELDVTLADPEADVAELRRMAAVVDRAAERARALVEALLFLARTDGAGLAVREQADLAVLVGQAWRAVRAAAEERGLDVVFRTGSGYVAGDPALLERIAGNLLENAVRHNVDGGWIEVDLHADPASPGSDEPGWVVLRVGSSGPEIPADRVAELFEPFRRGGVARTAQSGAGLGLSIVRAVVAAHGGEAYAAPVPGGGLSVTVRLPAA